MLPYYKIMNYSADRGKLKTLFHANNGSKIIPIKEWVWASKHKLVADGSNNTPYMSGWHIMKSKKDALKYLLEGFKVLKNKVIVECFCMGDIRQKEHSRSNIWLCQAIYLNQVVYLYVGDKEVDK